MNHISLYYLLISNYHLFKAFDAVNSDILLRKYGLELSAFSILGNYFSNQSQIVKFIVLLKS